ncbi:MAG: hypothetical protein Q9217_002739 [Psora testacea]
MPLTTLFRISSRNPPTCLLRATQLAAKRLPPPRSYAATPVKATNARTLSTSVKRSADESGTKPTGSNLHHEETFEEFTARYEKEFDGVQDVFELQRNLNNAFAYDLVPSPSVITAALRAARRVNDYPTAVRIFEGIKAKVENRGQYHEYLRELEALRDELGVDLKEDLYPEQRYTAGANTHG